MTTITINTASADSRFDMNQIEAARFFASVAQAAESNGYNVEFVEAIRVDQESEQFVTECFENYVH